MYFVMAPEGIKLIGIGAGILTSTSMLPQLIKTFKEKKSHDLSIIMIIVLMAGIAGWIFYGILRDDAPIIYTNSFSFLINCMLLFLRIKYAEHK